VAHKVPPEILALRKAFEDFEDFADAVWKAIDLPPLTARQREIANFLQHGPKRGFIAAFRGVGKSYISACYAVWRLFHNWDEQVLVMSGSSARSVDFSLWARKLLDNPKLPFLHHLRPSSDQRDSKLSWDVGPARLQHSASFAAVSVGSSIQGRRCTLAILDDAEQANNSGSQLQRETLLRNVMDVEAMLTPGKQSRIVCLGTFQSLNSVYLTMAAERGYEALYIPARVPEEIDEYDGKLSPGVLEMAIGGTPGEPTDPERFEDAHLTQMEVGMGQLQWQIQMMLSTKVSDRLSHPLALEDFIVWDGVNPFGAPQKIIAGRASENKIEDLPCYGLPGDAWYAPAFVDQKEMLPYGHLIMSIDPAGSSGADETAYVVLGAVPGGIYILDVGGFVDGSSKQTLERLAKIAERWKVREIIVENNMQAWPLLFQQTLHSVYPCQMTEVRATKNKVERIAGTLEPVLRTGQLIISRRVIETEYRASIKTKDNQRARARLLQVQAAMLKRGEKNGGIEHDDRLDALSQGVAELAPKFLHSETERAVKSMVEARQAEELENFMANCFGSRFKRSGNVWVNPRKL